MVWSVDYEKGTADYLSGKFPRIINARGKFFADPSSNCRSLSDAQLIHQCAFNDRLLTIYHNGEHDEWHYTRCVVIPEKKWC
jgi:hypothetical protein